MSDVTCPYCQRPAVLLKSSREVYGQDYGPIWICRPCRALGLGRIKASILGCSGRLANGRIGMRVAKMGASCRFRPALDEAGAHVAHGSL